MFLLSGSKKGRNILYNYKKRRFTNVNSHFNSRESNNLDTSNSDNVIANSNLSYINVQNYSLFNKFITFQKETHIELIVSIDDEIIDEIYISEEI